MMQQLSMAVTACIAGGMTVEKYDESTQELFDQARATLKASLERLDKLEDAVKGGYASLHSPTPKNDEL
jgi:hypothetical protein